jgi:molybdopterin-guanine dinucleotide biosynthesis protein A
MLGVVLCGGKSTRMGTDKGLIKQNAIPWAQLAYDKLSALDVKVVLSINRAQAETYQRVFQPSLLIEDWDQIEFKGPLRGLMSVHAKYPGEDLILLACDMPAMEVNILRQLLEYRNTDPSKDVYIFTNSGEPEPLCGIFCSAGLTKVFKMYSEKTLVKESMKFIIEHLHSYLIPLKAGEETYFININTDVELNGL